MAIIEVEYLESRLESIEEHSNNPKKYIQCLIDIYDEYQKNNDTSYKYQEFLALKMRVLKSYNFDLKLVISDYFISLPLEDKYNIVRGMCFFNNLMIEILSLSYFHKSGKYKNELRKLPESIIERKGFEFDVKEEDENKQFIYFCTNIAELFFENHVQEIKNKNYTIRKEIFEDTLLPPLIKEFLLNMLDIETGISIQSIKLGEMKKEKEKI